MPGTGDDAILHVAAGERRSHMRAEVIHGVELAMLMKHGDDPAIDFKAA
jgi:hypothetical protein